MARNSIPCRVCGAESSKLELKAEILSCLIDYYECPICLYLQTEEPFWLEQAYKDPINHTDTGLVTRNLYNTSVVQAVIKTLRIMEPKVLDVAGGYGLLVRLLRDFGVNAFWSDPFCENLLASGFDDTGGKFNLVTAFEVFEHSETPLNFIENCLSRAPNLLISSDLAPIPAPAIDEWDYYGTEHGQHIGFARKETMRFIADQVKKKLTIIDGRYHIFSDSAVNLVKIKTFIKIYGSLPNSLRYRNSKVKEDYEKNKNLSNI